MQIKLCKFNTLGRRYRKIIWVKKVITCLVYWYANFKETNIEEISEISEIECVPIEDEVNPVVKVIAVENLSTFQSCLKCKCKVIKLEDEEELGQCTKCDTLQFLSLTKHCVAAKMTVKSTDEEIFEVRAFGSILLSISETTEDNLTAVALTKAKPFIMQQRDGVIQSVKHPKSSFVLK